MVFTLLLGLSALLVAGSAAYFSVLGIATLFSGSYYQVLIMAATLEFGKIVATSYLYRYWTKTLWWLKLYLIGAILTLMAVTSLGVFGYLSAAYNINSGKFAQIDYQIKLVDQQKQNIDTEIEQIAQRINVLNEARKSQEQRLPKMSRSAAAPLYEDIKRSGLEIEKLTQRSQQLQTTKFEKDKEVAELNSEIYKAKDIGTFKFIAQALNKPLDTVVIAFICVLIFVFDPLAVALILCFNIATTGKILKEPKFDDSNDIPTSTSENSDDNQEPEQAVSRAIGYNINSK